MVWYHKFAFARNHREKCCIVSGNMHEGENKTNEVHDVKHTAEVEDYFDISKDIREEISAERQDKRLKLSPNETFPRRKSLCIRPIPIISIDKSLSTFDDKAPFDTTEIVHCPSTTVPGLNSPLLQTSVPSRCMLNSFSREIQDSTSLFSLMESPSIKLEPPSEFSPTSTSHVSSHLSTSSKLHMSPLFTSLKSPSKSASQHTDLLASTPVLSPSFPSYSPFRNKLESNEHIYRSATSSSQLPLFQYPDVKATASVEDFRHCPLLTTLSPTSPSIQLPHLAGSPLEERFRQSPFFDSSISSAASMHSPMSVLSSPHSPILHSPCAAKPSPPLNLSGTKTESSLFSPAYKDSDEFTSTIMTREGEGNGMNKVSIRQLSDILQCRWDYCTKRFSSLKEFFSHANRHVHDSQIAQAEYRCKWVGCARKGQGFNARYKLLTHIRTHTNEKPHKCSQCGKQFSRHENLKIHIRSHTGEKPCVCPYEGCGKAYSNSSDRFKHVRTHTEARPYSCKVPGCNKRYTDPSSLRKHIKSQSHYYNKSCNVYQQSNQIELC